MLNPQQLTDLSAIVNTLTADSISMGLLATTIKVVYLNSSGLLSNSRFTVSSPDKDMLRQLRDVGFNGNNSSTSVTLIARGDVGKANELQQMLEEMLGVKADVTTDTSRSLINRQGL